MTRFAVAILPLLLASCYIEPVAVGTWDIETEAGGATETAVWIISDPPAVTIEGPRRIEAEEVDFAGSRLSWSVAGPSTSSGGTDTSSASRINFRGTIDGNRLIGTLFTQFGNFSVTGSRRRNDE